MFREISCLFTSNKMTPVTQHQEDSITNVSPCAVTIHPRGFPYYRAVGMPPQEQSADAAWLHIAPVASSKNFGSCCRAEQRAHTQPCRTPSCNQPPLEPERSTPSLRAGPLCRQRIENRNDCGLCCWLDNAKQWAIPSPVH